MSSCEDLPPRIKEHFLKQANSDYDYQPLPNVYPITGLLYCLRKTFFQRQEYNKPLEQRRKIDLDAAINLGRGKIWDLNLTALYPRNQLRCTYRCKNVPVAVSGKLDFIDDDGAIVDLKCPKTLYYIREASPEYTKQVLFYCYCNAQTKGKIVYFDGGHAKAFPVNVTEEATEQLLSEIEEKAAVLYKAEQTGQPPEVYPTRDKEWLCRNCEYKQECGRKSSNV